MIVEKIRRDVKRRLKRERIDGFNKTKMETRQTFLDRIRQGKSIKEAREDLGFDLITACEIIDRNIESAMYLRKKTV